MARDFPKLTLVSKEEGTGSPKTVEISSGLTLVAPEQLSSTEARRIERIIDQVCPRAGLLAVAQMTPAWDLRPVLALSGESDPSIVRFSGPDVSTSHRAYGRLRELYEKISRFKDRSSAILDWGVFEDQLWYRRPLLADTLAHKLNEEFKHDLPQTVATIRSLVEEVSDWHSYGLIHGHIASSNIAFTPAGEVLLLDPGIAAACAQGGGDAHVRYGHSIAPEILEREALDYAADVYGLGQVIRRIFLALRKRHQFADDKAEIEQVVEPSLRLISTMVDSRAERRPKLAEVRAYLRDLRVSVPTEQKKVPVHRAGPEQTKPASRAPDRRDERSASAVKQKAAVPGEERADAGRGLHSVVWTRDGETEDEFTPFDYSRPPEKTERRSRELPLEENDQLDWEQNALLASELSVDAPEEEEDFFGFEPNLASSRERRAPEPTRPAPRRPRQAPASQAAAGGFWYFLMFLAVVLITVWYYFRGIQPGTESYGVDDLRLRWESRSPSRMVAVARLALTRGPEQHYAEEIILRSVMSGDTLPGGVDVDLLRIAFNSRWEKSLSAEDRRMALALGLAGLLDGALPTDLGKLSDRHPGVVFAVAASAGRNVSRFLKPIPAVVLTKLPPPYGPAFVKLTMNAADATCADDFVQQFARISTRGVERAQEIAEFLRQDSRVRLVALALMFSADNQLAKPLLDVLVNHPNLSLEQAEVKWAREWKLTQWADLEPGDQLFVLAGVPPSGRLDLENIGKLFMHPAAEIRVYAIQQALDRIKFAHPATWAVMQRVMRQPDMLSPEQLFKLAEILEKPASVSDERIKTWLTSQPPVPLDILTEMLLANSEQAQAMRLDAWIAVYLKGQGWEPDIAVLKRLAQHPDNYTRLFAYNQIFRLNDKDTARVFLRTALNKEKNPAYRRQLESMIGYLK